MPDLDEFLTLEELQASSRALVSEFPSLARLETVGTSSEGRPIELLTIGHGATPVLLLEKWMRDAKINDIFEGTQQINQLIVARRILGYSSKELS